VINDYTHVWRRVSSRGYGYSDHVPCRIIGRTHKRVRIAALQKDGTEKILSVLGENVRQRPKQEASV